MLRRLGWSVVVLFAIAVTTFFVTYILPADPARMIAGIRATPEDVDADPPRARAGPAVPGPARAVPRAASSTVTSATRTSRTGTSSGSSSSASRRPSSWRSPGCSSRWRSACRSASSRRPTRARSPDRFSTIFTTILVSAPSFLVGYLLLNFLAFQPQMLAHVEIFPIGGYKPFDLRYLGAAGAHPRLRARRPTTRA